MFVLLPIRSTMGGNVSFNQGFILVAIDLKTNKKLFALYLHPMLPFKDPFKDHIITCVIMPYNKIPWLFNLGLSKNEHYCRRHQYPGPGNRHRE